MIRFLPVGRFHHLGEQSGLTPSPASLGAASAGIENDNDSRRDVTGDSMIYWRGGDVIWSSGVGSRAARLHFEGPIFSVARHAIFETNKSKGIPYHLPKSPNNQDALLPSRAPVNG